MSRRNRHRRAVFTEAAYRVPLRQALTDDNTGHVNVVMCEADYRALKRGIGHLPPPTLAWISRRRSVEIQASEIRAPSQSFSGDQFLPQRFSDGLGSVASAELGLRMFQVTSNGFLADIERLGNLRRLRARGRQSQDGKFPGR